MSSQMIHGGTRYNHVVNSFKGTCDMSQIFNWRFLKVLEVLALQVLQVT